jgi:hypothetical protein
LQTHLGPSALVRQLAQWTPAPPVTGTAEVAARLAAWVGPLEAIQLQAALRPAAVAAPAGRAPLAPALDGEVARVRGVLAAPIGQDPLLLSGFPPASEEDPGFPPWQQRHAELQRQMGMMAAALRDHARQAVARAAPRLRQLAVLDATFEQMLGAREAGLLATLPAHLERRYLELRGADAQPTSIALARQPGGWLHIFAGDWRQVLLAELDLRLAPAVGLAQALRPSTFST